MTQHLKQADSAWGTDYPGDNDRCHLVDGTHVVPQTKAGSAVSHSPSLPNLAHKLALSTTTHHRPLNMGDISEADWARLLPVGFHRGAGRDEAFTFDRPFMAWWLCKTPGLDVGIPGIREMIVHVDCPEAGHYGREAQLLLARVPEPSEVRRKAARKFKGIPQEWDTSNLELQILVFEVAAARYAAGTFTPAGSA